MGIRRLNSKNQIFYTVKKIKQQFHKAIAAMPFLNLIKTINTAQILLIFWQNF